MTVLAPLQTWDVSRAARRLVRLLRRNAVVFQAAFALLWSVRLGVATGRWAAPLAVALIAAMSLRRAFSATSGLRARDEFRTARGRALLRPVTRLSILQLAASVVLPIAAAVAGAGQWALPLVGITIGVFLVGFGPLLQLTTVRWIGWLLTAGCVAIPLVTTGHTLTALVAAVTTVAVTLSMVWCAATSR